MENGTVEDNVDIAGSSDDDAEAELLGLTRKTKKKNTTKAITTNFCCRILEYKRHFARQLLNVTYNPDPSTTAWL